jgi:hypothetical protein
MPLVAILYLAAVGLGLIVIIGLVARAHERSSNEGAEGRRHSQWDVPPDSGGHHDAGHGH